MAIVKKKYFDVKLQVVNSTIPLYAPNQESLIGQRIKLDLTKILKGKNAGAMFLVKKQGDMLIGEIIEFRIYQAYVRRLIGRSVSIVEDSFVADVGDAFLRLKPFLVTRKKVHRSVRKNLRNNAREFLLKSVSGLTKDKVFQGVMSASLQKMLSKKLKKIYPLAVCELRVVKLEKNKKTEKAETKD